MVKVEPFGIYNQQEVQLITLQNKAGMVVKCATLGCTITYIGVPDRVGQIENVVCGFNCAEHYEQHPQYFGCAIGPFAGRLEQSIIEVDGKQFQAEPNEGPHLLHGGSDGFHAQIWSYEVGESNNTQFVRFLLKKKYTNFPGNIEMSITYTLTDENEIVFEYEGTSDEATLINVTNHSYFNLSGNLKRTICNHQLTVSTSQML
ncbi:MAG: galactose-1-epimerase, partial [Lysinibacillus sp.]